MDDPPASADSALLLLSSSSSYNAICCCNELTLLLESSLLVTKDGKICRPLTSSFYYYHHHQHCHHCSCCYNLHRFECDDVIVSAVAFRLAKSSDIRCDRASACFPGNLRPIGGVTCGDRRMSVSGAGRTVECGGKREISAAESAAALSFGSRPLLHVCRLLERRAHRKEFRRKGRTFL
jgi:hypothetical protein